MRTQQSIGLILWLSAPIDGPEIVFVCFYGVAPGETQDKYPMSVSSKLSQPAFVFVI